MAVRSKVHSSIVVAFLNVDGSITKSIIKSPPYMFGERTYAKLYTALPLIRQCSRCDSLCHNIDHCCRPATAIICPFCGGHHKAEQHAVCCPHKAKHEVTRCCNCAPTCINCRYAKRPCASHVTTDLNCPLRKQFHSDTCHTGDSTDEEECVLARMETDAPPPHSPVPTSKPEEHVMDTTPSPIPAPSPLNLA